MEPLKKDFTPEQLEHILSDIDQAPEQDKDDLQTEASIALAKRLGDELEEIVAFGGGGYSLQEHATADLSPRKKSSGGDQWLQELACQKIDEVLKQQNLKETINQVLQQILPPLAEKMIAQEISKIKEQIEGL